MRRLILPAAAITVLISSGIVAEARGFRGGGGFQGGGFRSASVGGGWRGGVGRPGWGAAGPIAGRPGWGAGRPGWGARPIAGRPGWGYGGYHRYGYGYRPYGYGLAGAAVGAAAGYALTSPAGDGECGPYAYYDAYAGVCRPY
ncbi:hypothetical protein [Methylobacterium sp. WSM2598]|uniref:hypothetical protein n=1 Tax=Methylobacterium sp. WSM2598 TaxID=398261 RepID=UPI000366E0AD|nr:hypothetical protein [Methylobacterium sp. WSM2598]